jgi:hypothetical protein
MPKGAVRGFREILSRARAATAGQKGAIAEIQVAKYLRGKGFNVKFIRQSSSGKSADILVDGVAHEIVAPGGADSRASLFQNIGRKGRQV